MFFDRHSAGISLAQKLREFKNKNVVVYALPKGGVPVGYEVAKSLNAPLDIVIVQKIGHPVSPDFGICAVSENGELVKDDCGLCGLEDSWLNYEVYQKLIEAKRRRQLYKNNQASISPEGKIAILVDDGIATGISYKAAINVIAESWPAEIVLATPVAPHYVIEDLKGMVDRMVVEQNERNFKGTIQSYYLDYGEVPDIEIKKLLADANHRQIDQLSHSKQIYHFVKA